MTDRINALAALQWEKAHHAARVALTDGTPLPYRDKSLSDAMRTALRLQAALDRAKKAGDELKKRPDRLLVITGIYEQTEQQNVGSAQELDTNVIS